MVHSDFFCEGNKAQIVQPGERSQLVVRESGSTLPESEGMVKVRDGGGVPRAASQRTRLEGIEIVGKVGDDHFHNFMWETAGWFVRVARLWRAVPEEAIERGFALTPNGHHVSRKVSPCDTNRSQNGSHALVGGLLLNIEDTGSLEGFIF